MPNSGLLISCATVAASLPMDAIFSELSRVLWTRLQFRGLAPHALFDLGLHAFHLGGHLVEGARQVAQFVVRAHRQAVGQVAVRHAVRAIDQFLHRPVDHHPDEGHRQRRTDQHRRPPGTRPGWPGAARSARPPWPARDWRRSRPAPAGPRGCTWHAALEHSGEFSIGRITPSTLLPLPVRENARAVRAVQLGQRSRLLVAAVAGLGVLVHHRVQLGGVGGEA